MMENSIGSQEVGVGAVIDDPDQQACDDVAATMDGGAASSSWYWTSMLNFSQSGSSSTHTSAGQMAPSHLSAAAASPPSSSSVHIQHVDQHPPSFDNLLASHANTTNNSTLSNDPEQSVWSQEFLSGPIGESKPSIHACSTDDGLQELLYPRTVRELLFSDQLKLDPSPSWDLLQQAAISKSFGFPLGPDDNTQSLALPHLQSANADIEPGQLLHYSHSQPPRKEKLGKRITTLQQLVSPFGKTDTASVLCEAIGYIKFLQNQVETLSSPYLKSTSNTTLTQSGNKGQNGEEVKPDLRSKGLCLVPLSCTMEGANDNGVDYWYGGAFI